MLVVQLHHVLGGGGMADQRIRGFSLIELMVTLSIVALLIAAVAPSVTAWLVDIRIRGLAESLVNGLQTARNEAVRRNQNIGFYLVSSTDGMLTSSCTLSSSSGSWVVSAQSPVSHCTDTPSATTAPMIVATFSAGGQASSSLAVTGLQTNESTAANMVTFNGFGRVVNSTGLGRIDVKSATSASRYRTLQVMISPTGSIRMCDPAVTSASDPRICPTPPSS